MIELVIVMAITSIIMGAIGSIFYQVLVVPPRESDQLTAINELRLALDRIQHDGVQAQSFTPEDAPNYGYFCSKDGPDDSECYIEVAYKYDGGQLIREESIDGELTTTTVIAFHIAYAPDVGFSYGEANSVTVNMTVTLNPGTANEISETDTRYIDMRAWDGSS
ncbi:MAG: hypothetical protein KAH98_02940 [Dehalococcoidia bacterium]|nr:hypothetical protein [Dehalococcoidia bacterium]MCK5654071.1 hypothetical protein [Dehalococcoidia bacterium]